MPNQRDTGMARLHRRTLLRLAVPLAAAAAAAAALPSLVDGDPGGSAAADTTTPAGDPGSLGAGTATRAAAVETTYADRLDALLTERAEELAAGSGADVSVAASRGALQIAHRPDLQHDTASIVKAQLLVMALRHYGTVADAPGARLRAMITASDNDAATAVYDALGGADALAQACTDFGMTGTEPREDAWGLTDTTAPDQLTLLGHALYEGLLDADQTAYARDLMSSVTASQRWGVSAAAADGEAVWLKNGWDTRTALGGRWVVNSIGVLAGDTDDPIRIAVLTSGSASHADGIALVESLAALARTTLDGGLRQPDLQ
ncbi:serine hydrolase [Glycomyces artemisiae]|uniref:Beta-lactamase n=1 Tax=Glycomyces artemisiae TaxID=1076443 RepID=A0A2T0UF71_9ACTN|nr:serine hydrolase [Glycomyces artemisiae]PRY56586.1 beta-lactamase family protein [Glycomyces artemisiae]